MFYQEVFLLLSTVIVAFGEVNAKSKNRLVGPNVCSKQTMESATHSKGYVQVHCRNPQILPCHIEIVQKPLPKYECCEGYKETEESTCVPHCETTCVYGTCSKPNTCQCEPGYIGFACEEARCPYIHALSGVPHCELVIIGFVIGSSTLILVGVYIIYKKLFTTRYNDGSSLEKSFEPGLFQWDNPFYFGHKFQQSPDNVRKNEQKTNNGKEETFEMTKGDVSNLCTKGIDSIKMRTTVDNVYTDEKLRPRRASESIYYLKPQSPTSNENNVSDCYEEVLPPPFYIDLEDQNSSFEELPTENIYSEIS